MTKKIICLAVSLIMLFSLAACGDMQSKLDELQKRIDKQDGKIAELENENEGKDGKISDLEQELQKTKAESVRDDFVLAVTVDSTVARLGGTIKVNAVLHNQCGKGHYIGYSSPQKGWHIDGWREDDSSDSSSAYYNQIYFGKDTSIPFSYNIFVDNQEPGMYELEIVFIFVLGDISDEGIPMTIRSEKVSIRVIGDL